MGGNYASIDDEGSEARTINIMNVYNDANQTAVRLLRSRTEHLPPLAYMGGDFNCHSSVWDHKVPHHRADAIRLLDVAADLGLEIAAPVNPGSTCFTRVVDKDYSSVIDLVFVPATESLRALPVLEHIHRGTSDHVPVATAIPVGLEVPEISRLRIKPDSDAYKAFVDEITRCLSQSSRGMTESAEGEFRGSLSQLVPEPAYQAPAIDAGQIDARAQAVADIFAAAWAHYATAARVSPHSN